MDLLIREGASVSYTDPYVPRLSVGGRTFESVDFDRAVRLPIDCAVVATDHRLFDYSRIAEMALVVDTRNALRSIISKTIFRL
jgi:UDP-N-acetyl-D-glucosamine dehydrogenase